MLHPFRLLDLGDHGRIVAVLEKVSGEATSKRRPNATSRLEVNTPVLRSVHTRCFHRPGPNSGRPEPDGPDGSLRRTEAAAEALEELAEGAPLLGPMHSGSIGVGRFGGEHQWRS